MQQSQTLEKFQEDFKEEIWNTFSIQSMMCSDSNHDNKMNAAFNEWIEYTLGNELLMSKLYKTYKEA